MKPSGKPPFRLPSMADVARARGTAGLTVASTFSGCGGSCLGFEMAGYDVLWANEFLPIAQDSYRANHPKTVLDGRDIAKVQASEILDAIGMKPGELDVFNGSPPCQAFSSAGQRDKGWGKERDYGNGVAQKNEDLFFEYVRLLGGLQPRVFVAENVAGLTRGRALGYFKDILRGLTAAGYRVRCKVLDAQWLGVPQTRARAIFIGVRNDLGLEADFPKPLAHRYSLRDVLPGIARSGNRGMKNWKNRPEYHGGINLQSIDEPQSCITSSAPTDFFDAETNYLAKGSKALEDWQSRRSPSDRARYYSLTKADPNAPAPCIMSSQGTSGGNTASATHWHEPRRFTIEELRIVCSFPADFILKGTYAEQWARLGNAVPPVMMRHIAATLRDGIFGKLGRTKPGFTEAL
jgi:DNA (cytosine-5)-methyltransferase 1